MALDFGALGIAYLLRLPIIWFLLVFTGPLLLFPSLFHELAGVPTYRLDWRNVSRLWISFLVVSLTLQDKKQ